MRIGTNHVLPKKLYIYVIYLIDKMFWYAFIFFTNKLALCQRTPMSQMRIHNFKQLKDVLKAFKI